MRDTAAESTQIRRIYPIFGIIAALAYLAAVIVGGLLWPGYSHLRQAISELTMASAPNQLIMQPMFMLYNLSLFLFAIGLFRGFRNKLVKSSAILLGLVAFSGMMMYFSPQDPVNTALTFRGLMHFVLAGIEALGTIVAIYLGGIGLSQTKGLEILKPLSIIFGSIVLVIGGLTPAMMSALPDYFGIFERITIGSFMVWTFVTSLYLLKARTTIVQ